MRFLKFQSLTIIFVLCAVTVIPTAESDEGVQLAGEMAAMVGGYVMLCPTYKLGTFTLNRMHINPTYTIVGTSMATALVSSTAGYLIDKSVFDNYETNLYAALIGGGSSVILSAVVGRVRFRDEHGFAGGSAVGIFLAPLGAAIGNYVWYQFIRSDDESKRKQ